jgi:micrococcal nuclease
LLAAPTLGENSERRRASILVALLLSLACGASAAAQAPAATLQATLRVRQVFDGDTITVSGVGTVRLIGVDAPEKTGGYRQSEPYGDEATRFMKALVDGKLVRLEYDGERKDPYDRTLAYVYLEDGTLANEAIIRAGLAETYRRFTYRLKAQFQAAEKEAREARRGMWAGRR